MPADIEELVQQLKQQTDPNGLPTGLSVDGWQCASVPPGTAMRGEYCRLERLNSEAHHSELFDSFALDNDARNWTYMPYGPFSSVQAFRQWCEKMESSDDPQFYSVIDRPSGKAVGVASFLRIAPEAGSIEVGHIHFSPLMQGTRLSTEAMYLMMRSVFDELGYRRYEWKCDALNAPSRKAAARLGFQFEGIFRQATVYKGRNRDTAWFSILDKEWPRLRVGFESWLSSENFDADGRQIRTLKELQKVYY